jgi:ComF family protein
MDCKGRISFFTQPICQRCGRPFSDNRDLCGNCLVSSIPAYRKHISCFAYKNEVKELILKYKYGNKEYLKELLAEYYLELFHRDIEEDFDFILPVPPDQGRRREYQPVIELSKILSKRLRIKLLANCLIKVKITKPQAGLTRSERLRNLNGAFSLKVSDKCLKGKKVLLIDDIYTTGTTINKCAKLLTREGADVFAFTLARSI